MKHPAATAALGEWLHYLSVKHPPDRILLGLERVLQAALALDVLPPARRNLVIAGTNGKGSTAVFVEQLLLAEGLRTGTTLSPHLTRFNERIRVNGIEASDAEIGRALYTVETRCQASDLTYFERVILAALWLFKQAELDVCVLEVGLGGRLDAVNIVDADVSVITSIGLDHTAFLGDNLNAIAAEKAGIMRHGKPCILGADELPQSIYQRATELQVPLHQPGDNYGLQRCTGTDPETWSFWFSDPSAEYQIGNLSLPHIALPNAASALAAVCALGLYPNHESIETALRQTRLPGRFEKRETASGRVILDVAHNVAAADFLAVQLARDAVECPQNGITYAIAGFLADKNPAAIVAALKGQVDHWVLVGIPGERGLSEHQTAELLEQILEPETYECDNLEAVITSINSGRYRGSRVVILGCFRLIESCLERLQTGDLRSNADE